jgi:hypothetical protein
LLVEETGVLGEFDYDGNKRIIYWTSHQVKHKQCRIAKVTFFLSCHRKFHMNWIF